MADVRPYPLVFEPVLLEKVWGGRGLSRLGKHLASPTARYGESWEVADLDSTSTSGAGGGAVRSVVANGPLAGRTIRDAMSVIDAGRAGPLPFPLLIKFLDAGENLSVQVHPSPQVAGREGAHLKTESWYVVAAEPGAKLYIGLRPGTKRADVAAAVASGDRSRIVALLHESPAIVGECHTLPSGIIHALGAGVLVAEVQTPSDTTFRLYDWGRPGREMHTDAALESAFNDDGSQSVTAAQRAGPMADGELCARLAETPFYVIDETRPRDGDDVTVGFPCLCEERARDKSARGERGFVLIVIDGSGELAASEGDFSSVPLSAGTTVYVPAACARQAVLRGVRGLRALRVGIPENSVY